MLVKNLLHHAVLNGFSFQVGGLSRVPLLRYSTTHPPELSIS